MSRQKTTLNGPTIAPNQRPPSYRCRCCGTDHEHSAWMYANWDWIVRAVCDFCDGSNTLLAGEVLTFELKKEAA